MVFNMLIVRNNKEFREKKTKIELNEQIKWLEEEKGGKNIHIKKMSL